MTPDLKTITQELALFQKNTLETIDGIEKKTDKLKSTQAQMEQGFGEMLKGLDNSIDDVSKQMNIIVGRVQKLENTNPKESIFNRIWRKKRT